MKFSRQWVMPDACTFRMRPVADLLDRVLDGRSSVADPFARTSKRAHYSNDLDPSFGHAYNLDARAFSVELERQGVRLDAVLFDPPYSPRQITECYKGIGLRTTMSDTQSAALYSSVRDTLSGLCPVGAVAVSFGWNSVGFGKDRGWEQEEILLLCHGGAHNDTIIVVERKIQGELFA